MQSVQQLFDIEAIRRLKARYFRCFDTKDWDGWLGLFTHDATLESRVVVTPKGADGPAKKLIGKKATAANVAAKPHKPKTVPQGNMGKSTSFRIRKRTESGPWKTLST